MSRAQKLEPLTYSIPEAAALLGISKDLCYSLAQRNEIPVLRLGPRRLVVPRVALERLLGEVDGRERA